MSGGWLKDHKKELLGSAAVIGTAGMAAPVVAPAMAGLLGTGAAAGAGAAAAPAVESGLLGGLGAGAADEMLSAVPATMGDKLGTMWGNAVYGGGLDKADKIFRLAGASQSLLGGDQQRPIQPQGRPVIARPQPLELPSFWTDPQEEEKKRQLAMLMMQQQGGYYG